MLGESRSEAVVFAAIGNKRGDSGVGLMGSKIGGMLFYPLFYWVKTKGMEKGKLF